MELRIILGAAAAVFMAGSALAAEDKCFEEVPGEPVMSCTGQAWSNSADFADSCSWVPGPNVLLEVECPPGDAVWMPTVMMTASNVERRKIDGVPQGNHSPVPLHEWHCGQHGMVPASVDGQICASGNNRPKTGAGWESIGYPYASKGTPTPLGGTKFSTNTAVLYYDLCLPHRMASGAEDYRPELPVAVACKPCPGGCPRPKPIPTGLYGPSKYDTWYWNESTVPTKAWLDAGLPW